MPNSYEAGKPPVPGSPGNREPVHSSLPRGVTAENPVREHEHSQAGSRGFHGRCPALASATAVAVPSGKRPSSSLAQAAPAAAFPGELRRAALRNPGVCAKKGVSFLLWGVNTVSCRLGFLFFYYLKDREQIRKNELQTTANSTSSPNICSHNRVETLKICQWSWCCL